MAAGLIVYGVRKLFKDDWILNDSIFFKNEGFRQDIYENNSFPVSVMKGNQSETYNIYSIKIHAKSKGKNKMIY